MVEYSRDKNGNFVVHIVCEICGLTYSGSIPKGWELFFPTFHIKLGENDFEHLDGCCNNCSSFYCKDFVISKTDFNRVRSQFGLEPLFQDPQ